MIKKEKVLLLIDFDQTIVRQNSFRIFYLEYLSFLRLAYCFVLGVASGLGGLRSGNAFLHNFKKRFQENALNGCSLGEFSRVCDLVSKKLNVNSQVTALKNKYSRSQLTVVVVTASPEKLIKRLLSNLGIIYDKIIATDIIFKHNNFVAMGVECFAEQKALQIQTQLDLTEYDRVVAIGNLPEDSSMLQIANEKYHVSKGRNLITEIK